MVLFLCSDLAVLDGGRTVTGGAATNLMGPKPTGWLGREITSDYLANALIIDAEKDADNNS